MNNAAPLDVQFLTKSNKRTGQWLLCVFEPDGDMTTLTGQVPGADTAELTRANTVLAGFEALLNLAASGRHILLDVPHYKTRTKIKSILHLAPAIGMVPISSASPFLRGRATAALASLPRPVDTEQTEPEPATAYLLTADASISTWGKTAGLGWVLSTEGGDVVACGKRSMPVTRAGDILTAEVAAIRDGVIGAANAAPLHQRGHRKLIIQSDSRGALGLIRKVGEGNPPSACTPEQQALVQAILKRVKNLEVTYRWVKGHSGNELNESADRLAVLARRNREFGVDDDTDELMFARARRDIVHPAAA